MRLDPIHRNMRPFLASYDPLDVSALSMLTA